MHILLCTFVSLLLYCAHVIMFLPFPGSQTPNPVTNITLFSVTDISVLLQFVVTSLVFTPETYRMQYGLQSDNLDMTSPVTANLNDFDITNIQLIVGTAGLVPNTIYYYRIQATNTVGTTSSAVSSMTTLPARESCTHIKCVYFVCWDIYGHVCGLIVILCILLSGKYPHSYGIICI